MKICRLRMTALAATFAALATTGLVSGAYASGGDGPVTVKFPTGTSGNFYNGTLAAGDAIQYILDAHKNQMMWVTVHSGGAQMYYHITNPDGSSLLDGIDTSKPYQGQLWQTGKHIIEIVNQTSSPADYSVEFKVK